MTIYSPTATYANADPTAVVGKRILAAVIDAVIVGVILFATVRGVVDLKREKIPSAINKSDACNILQNNEGYNFCFTINDNVYYAKNGSAGAVLTLIGVGLPLLNHVVLTGLTGASVGKHALGLRVIRKDNGQLVGFGPAFVRWIVGIVDLGCCPLIGLILILTTKGHRRLGDMAASTFVVGKESVGRRPVVPGVTGSESYPYAAPTYPGPSSFPSPASPPPGSTSGTWTSPSPPAGPSSGTWASPSSPVPPAATPAPGPFEPPAAASPPPAAAASGTPTWDPARNTYIFFDPSQNKWLQWDAAQQQWRPLS